MTPASLRAGGATAYFDLLEDPAWLRLRGRWANLSTVEIYVQEVVPWLVLASLGAPCRHRLDILSQLLRPAVAFTVAALAAGTCESDFWDRFLRAFGPQVSAP